MRKTAVADFEFMEYVLLFLEGMITFLSPCILPMLPLYISYFSGAGSGEDRGRYGVLINAAGFVVGFTAVFTLIGTMAGTFGAWLKEYQRIVELVSGAVIVIFGLNYIGILKLKILEKSYRMNLEIRTFRFFSSILFGIIFAVGWTPCVGTFLGSALMVAVQAGAAVKGAGMLFVYSMGLGIPFVLCGVFIDSLKGTFSYLKRHYDVINKVSGTILVIMGIAMMTGTFNRVLAIFTGSGIR